MPSYYFLKSRKRHDEVTAVDIIGWLSSSSDTTSSTIKTYFYALFCFHLESVGPLFVPNLVINSANSVCRIGSDTNFSF